MKTMVAAGRWPDDVEYDLPREGPRFEGEKEREDGRLSYTYAGGERCGWCDRPIQECIDDPCEHYQNG